ncbi:MAG: hypothetical protein P8K80_04590, partial [Phycisphaerales bacterium]|nr:hypothetical protein [Phycisphaerales bacterium]
MRHHLAIIGASLLLAATASATADTLDVCLDGCTYSNIQDAIDAASSGDRIEIGPGTYYENLDINNKSLHLVGIAGRGATFVDGEGTSRPLTIQEGIDGTTVLEGITFQKGYVNIGEGGGISSKSSLHMLDCAVIKCEVHNGSPGGIYSYGFGGEPCLFSNVVIQGNTATSNYLDLVGGGGGFYSQDTVITGCTIENNMLSYTGGSSGYNTRGGGCYLATANVTVEDTLIRNNSVQNGGNEENEKGSGIYAIDAFFMNNSVVCGNTGGSDSLDNQVDGAFAGSGNFVSDTCETESGPYGACCTDAGCIDVDYQVHCLLLGGYYAGPYTDCKTTECGAEDAFGACCIGGNCAFIRASACDDLAGQWQGDFVTCQSSSCTPPPPFGACCYGGSCTELTEEVCNDLMGDWRGADTACIEEDCSIPPATG